MCSQQFNNWNEIDTVVWRGNKSNLSLFSSKEEAYNPPEPEGSLNLQILNRNLSQYPKMTK